MRKGSNSPSSFKVGDIVIFIEESTLYRVTNYRDRDRLVTMDNIKDDRYSRVVPINWVEPYNITKRCKAWIKNILMTY